MEIQTVEVIYTLDKVSESAILLYSLGNIRSHTSVVKPFSRLTHQHCKVPANLVLTNGTRVHASLEGTWFQWGGTTKELGATIELTEQLNAVVNAYLNGWD